MEVGVRVEAENPLTGERRHTSTAYLTMVALDDEGRPTPVPPLLAETEAEQRRQREAESGAGNRLDGARGDRRRRAPARIRPSRLAAQRRAMRSPAEEDASHISGAMSGATSATGIEARNTAATMKLAVPA